MFDLLVEFDQSNLHTPFIANDMKPELIGSVLEHTGMAEVVAALHDFDFSKSPGEYTVMPGVRVNIRASH